MAKREGINNPDILEYSGELKSEIRTEKEILKEGIESEIVAIEELLIKLEEKFNSFAEKEGDVDVENLNEILAKYRKSLDVLLKIRTSKKKMNSLNDLKKAVNGELEAELVLEDSDLTADLAPEIEDESGSDIKETVRILRDPLTEKAIKDREFGLHKMGADLDAELIDKRKKEVLEIRKDIEIFKNETASLLVGFGAKIEKFKVDFPEANFIIGDMERVKGEYAQDLEKFNPSDDNQCTHENFKKINQLYHKLYELVRRDWNELYKNKLKSRQDKTGEILSDVNVENVENNLEEKNTDSILEELSNDEFHGADSPVIEDVRRIEMERVVNRKYGEVNTDYIKRSEQGFPVDSFTIVGYKLSGMGDNFIEIEKLINGENKKERINLNEFDEYLSVGGYERENNSESGIGGKEKLTQDEQLELRKFVEEILDKIDADLISLKDLLRTKDVEQRIKDRISLYEEKGLKKIKEIIAKDKNIFESQDVLNLVDTLHLKIRTILDNLSDDSQRDNLKNEEGKNIEFNDDEKKKLEIIENSLAGIIEKWKSEFDWGDNFPKGRINQMLEIQTLVFLKKNFRGKGWFVGQEEEVAEFILKNKK